MIVVVTEPSGSKEEKTPARTAESNINDTTTHGADEGFVIPFINNRKIFLQDPLFQDVSSFIICVATPKGWVWIWI